MTLILNEIHIKREQSDSYIIACADRRITYKEGTQLKNLPRTTKKLFKIDYLNSCLSYWGNTRAKSDFGNFELLSSWLPNFIKRNSHIDNLAEFASCLQKKLNQKMHSNDLKTWASGFHLCGFNKERVPEFYHFSNASWDNEKDKYFNVSHKFSELTADFADEHFKEFFIGEEINWLNIKQTGKRVYRNGDFIVQDAMWEKLDKTLKEIFDTSNFSFKIEKNDENLIKYYQFKLKFIGDIYQKWGRTKNVGGPFDIVVIRPKK